jgi:hypothetical protein
MSRPVPEWFIAGEAAAPQVMRRIADSVRDVPMAMQVRSAPMLAHWFLLDTLLLANNANREGMHANALALTRQCVEAINIVELGLCRHVGAEAVLLQWDADKLNPGRLRAWLQDNVWPQYGSGLWTEVWSVFMREFTAAVQPYAHYSSALAQWQGRLHAFDPTPPGQPGEAIIELRPRAHDPQKATRITLFHGILTFTLGRIWMAANPNDKEFGALINRLRVALGRSRYLDGHQTNWGQQFWAMVWDRRGGTLLE